MRLPAGSVKGERDDAGNHGAWYHADFAGSPAYGTSVRAGCHQISRTGTTSRQFRRRGRRAFFEYAALERETGVSRAGGTYSGVEVRYRLAE
jgi:hypothetical protein